MAQGNGNGHGKIRFPLIDYADIALGDDEQPYLIQNIVPRDGLMIVWGPPKCGKSFFITDLSLHVAFGWEYRGRRVEKGTVVYIACEGQTGFRKRIEAFRQERCSEETANPPFKLLPTRLDLAEDCDLLMHDVIAQLGVASCSLIVIDTLNRSLGGSENSDEDMSAYILACDKLRERFGCTVIVIHHCGTEGTRPRGHTSLQGAADTQIAVKKDENDNVQATIEYMKDGESGEILLSKLRRVEVGKNSYDEAITSCVVDSANEFAAKRSKQPAIPDAAKIAIKAMRTALDQGGQQAPPTNQIPPAVTVVTLDLWRRFYYAAVPNELGDEARKKAFQRAREKLQSLELIGVHNEWCWLT